MKKIMIVLLIGILLLTGCYTCVKSHYEMVHHPAYTQPIMMGKMTTYMHHNAYDSNESICDEWVKDK